MLSGNDFTTNQDKVTVRKGKREVIDWPLTNGWYDVTVTADTGEQFSYRYAGKIE